MIPVLNTTHLDKIPLTYRMNTIIGNYSIEGIPDQCYDSINIKVDHARINVYCEHYSAFLK